MTVKLAVWTGGATSGSGLTVGTAWDVTYALADPSRLAAGDELRICEPASPFTMTFANRLRMKCGTGTRNNPVRVVAADADGNPYAGRRQSFNIYAGDNRTTWGTSAAVSPAMFTVDSEGGLGQDYPIQYWEIEDFCFDGVDGRPYTGIANQGASNNVYRNWGGKVRNCSFLDVYHNVLSVSACEDKAGTTAIWDDRRITFEGCVATCATTASPTAGVISRPGPSANSGFILRNCEIDMRSQLYVAVRLDGQESASEVSGCVIRNASVGISHNSVLRGDKCESNVLVQCLVGSSMKFAEDHAKNCLFVRCTKAIESVVADLSKSTHNLRGSSFVACGDALYDSNEGVAVAIDRGTAKAIIAEAMSQLGSRPGYD